ncbi:MAG: FAD-dependent oxidoreductase [Deltaproteobacteria bacterium]|nr:FAD-dependent oxidoreductase [Deltaproteobacteria bacterium]
MASGKKTATLKAANIRILIDTQISLHEIAAQRLDLPVSQIKTVTILRRSTDARQRRIFYVYTLVVRLELSVAELDGLLKQNDISLYLEKKIAFPASTPSARGRPVVVGCGPAGIFAAFSLAERGIPPLVFEQGEPVEERARTVRRFWQQGELNPSSNVFFGAGGAGTFSDGKLTSRSKSSLKKKIFEILVDAGADDHILYENKPHIGTDKLQKIIPALVELLKTKGVEFRFNTKVTDIDIENGRVTGLSAGSEIIRTGDLFLASGHSARDFYEMLFRKGVQLKGKDFAVGLRIEHPQEFIDQALLGIWAGSPLLGSADYFMSFKDAASGRGVYTFCMCPGGTVIGCTTEPDGLCINGMSTSARHTFHANAAVVVTVRHADFNSDDVLAGIAFQRELEKKAFQLGGEPFFAPAQRAADFMRTGSENYSPAPLSSSYRPGTACADLRSLLPDYLCQPLQRGLAAFDLKIPGFLREGILIGPETRTSAPVRIVRDPRSYHAVGVDGLIPVGEGAGYAGGIVSSAVDGMQAALHFK